MRLLDGENTVFAFEPVPPLIPILQDRFANNENFYLVPMAVDVEPGWRWFNVSNQADRGVSSLYDFNPHIDELWSGPEFRYLKRYRVMTTRLDSFMEANGIDEVAYLWIDAQGNDF